MKSLHRSWGLGSDKGHDQTAAAAVAVARHSKEPPNWLSHLLLTRPGSRGWWWQPHWRWRYWRWSWWQQAGVGWVEVGVRFLARMDERLQVFRAH